MKNNLLTYYQLLGVATNATTKQIQDAYMKMVKAHHPDRNHGVASSNVLVQYYNQAREILTDPIKRLEYDYIIGVKKKPKPPSKNQNLPKGGGFTGRDIAKGAAAAGILGLIIGIAIGGGRK